MATSSESANAKSEDYKRNTIQKKHYTKEEEVFIYPPDFEKFWAEYPKKKGGKLYSFRCFEKVKVPFNTLLEAVIRQKKGADWKKEGGQYIPNPATWLNRGQWEDEKQDNDNEIDKIWKATK